MHDNSTLNDPHECARSIVEALKALGLWPSNGAGVELPSRARARSGRGIGSLKSLLRKACSAEFLPEAAGRARVSGRAVAFAGWQ